LEVYLTLMNSKQNSMIRQFALLTIILFITSGFISKSFLKLETDLVKSNIWHIAGPVTESQKQLITFGKKKASFVSPQRIIRLVKLN